MWLQLSGKDPVTYNDITVFQHRWHAAVHFSHTTWCSECWESADLLHGCNCQLDGFQLPQNELVKTDLMRCTSCRRQHQLSSDPVTFIGATIQPSSTVRDLEVILDTELSFGSHVSQLVSRCFHQLRSIIKSLPIDAAEMLVKSFVVSKTDYCNCLLVGCPCHQLDQLQAVMNTAARLIFGLGKYHSIQHVIRDRLHWLLVQKHIQFKLCLLAFKVVNSFALSYLADLCCPVSTVDSRRRLRYAARLHYAARGDLVRLSSTHSILTLDSDYFPSWLRRHGMICRTGCTTISQLIRLGCIENIFIHFIDWLTNIFIESTRALVIALLCYGALEVVIVILLLLLNAANRICQISVCRQLQSILHHWLYYMMHTCLTCLLTAETTVTLYCLVYALVCACPAGIFSYTVVQIVIQLTVEIAQCLSFCYDDIVLLVRLK